MIRPPPVRPGRPYLAGPPIFCAHRGGAKLAPENTLAAFGPAVERWGADMLEMDVHASADGKIVVIHDPTVDRTTDGTGRVADLPWAALRELDAGHRFLDLDGKPAFRSRGVRLPLFEEILEAFPRTRLNVEIKDARAAPGFVALVRRFDAARRVLLAAEFERARRDVVGYPGAWGASRRQLILFKLLHDTPLSSLYTPNADVLQVPHTWRGQAVVTARFLAEAHRRNLPVHVWTVDEPAAMRGLLELGVDGVQTDRPDLLAEVFARVAGRPPPSAATTVGSGPNRGG